jgi:hypothetical protein
MTSAELAKLCESYTGTVKRPMITKYRWTMPSGKLAAAKYEAPVKYLKDAYRADKKRAGNAPPNLWFARPVTPTSNKTRD